MFGKVTATRIAYRGTGVADLHPADAVLNMPVGMYSHGVAKLAAIEADRGSFAEAAQRVNALTGAGVGYRQVLELAVGAAGDIDAFYDALVPLPLRARSRRGPHRDPPPPSSPTHRKIACVPPPPSETSQGDKKSRGTASLDRYVGR
ncbi:hypothetical protein [Streptomyces mirabilis]|uniref:hypothetical protein n=1 Tax=Streptomyces mirabilis TaxID=68239 RepID=UPI00224F46FA|nr:hypothetical protein [Streptomyces mirabilis]MCX4428996.1 hypothetical protein [Streptomyces mirabilis]